MYVKNSKGLTLIELLATLSISIIILGLVSSVLIQSYRSMEVSNTHIDLRQEANIIITMLANAHEKNNYEIFYSKTENDEWEIMIGDQKIISRDYDLVVKLISDNSTLEIDTSITDPQSISLLFTVNVKEPLHVQELRLTDINDPTKSFELSTIISRL
ncbi:hypothetical protein BKP45_12365 [Anaerobacillus alkalidiazotrophicus]|uniref:Prepilin-type N-terminal cleavage/methylation domain-containing protein n=1 Tax=Anaerobacillus alkalidiazotrophicus TaxID=472963 RepID=A0A1S2M1Q5_9BACI|nr:prepilin-type N-terminal cleavage/methylation domain-containing protein [Anaerobacillus alkalidiazotrophicus]OIJ18363.1 hypothetical protein BKP45_18080 [Anaerobacillus alkalidiazotrophicus]OIJ19842.1 hypothetical protein BKP45_12365 [Anaerobacillus alkalidiazotrophicus]